MPAFLNLDDLAQARIMLGNPPPAYPESTCPSGKNMPPPIAPPSPKHCMNTYSVSPNPDSRPPPRRNQMDMSTTMVHPIQMGV